jgi:hypothetical protein
MTSGWDTYNSATIAYVSAGVQVTPTAIDHGAYRYVGGPINLIDSAIKMVVTVDSNFDASNASLQTIVQLNGQGGVYTQVSGCWFDQSSITANTDLSIYCVYPGLAAAFNETGTDALRVGIQAKGATPAGSFTIKSVSIIPKTIELSMDVSNWSTISSGSSIAQNSSYLNFTPTANNGAAAYLYTGPTNFTGAYVTFVANVDTTFYNSGAALQPYVQDHSTPANADYNCGYYGNYAFNAGSDAAIFCRQAAGSFLNLGSGQQIRFVLKAAGTPAPGTITIKRAFINLPQ